MSNFWNNTNTFRGYISNDINVFLPALQRVPRHYSSGDTIVHYSSWDTIVHYSSGDTIVHYSSGDTIVNYSSWDTIVHETHNMLWCNKFVAYIIEYL